MSEVSEPVQLASSAALLNTASTRLIRGYAKVGISEKALPPGTLATILNFIATFLNLGGCIPTPTPTPAKTAESVKNLVNTNPILAELLLQRAMRREGTIQNPAIAAVAVVNMAKESTPEEIASFAGLESTIDSINS